MLFKRLKKLDSDVIAHKTCKRIVFVYRLGHEIYNNTDNMNRISIIYYKTIYKILKLIYMNANICEIPPTCDIGNNFRLDHNGRGVVIHPKAIIGKNVRVLHQVTIGTTYTDPNHGVPEIGDNVLIGAGAKILGSVRIGSNVRIGANSVVVKDIPDNVVVGGIPAKVIKNLS